MAALLVAVLASTAASAQTASNVNAGQLLMPFVYSLTQADLQADNLGQAIMINNQSSSTQRTRAISDSNFALTTGSVLADGFGPRLDGIYQSAIDGGSPLLAASGNIVKAFSQANGLATSDAGFAKIFLNNTALTVNGSNAGDIRPFQRAPAQIDNFAPGLTSPLVDNPSFPSGHATFAYTQELLFAIMVPERYQQTLTRASEYGDSRIVLGAHYPLDIIGGRILATYDVVQLLNDNPAYLNQSVPLLGGGSVTTASDFSSLFANATTDLRNLLQQGCGSDIATCAASGSSDRFSNPQQNRSDYTYRLTYGLPPTGPTDLPPVVPTGAEVLLKTRFPYLSVEQRRDVLATTELPSGVPLDDGSGWARLNLYAAADGYGAFNSDVALTMDASQGGYNARDSWNNDITGSGGLTLRGTGTLVLTGADTYTGPTVIDGGTLIVDGSITSATLVNPGGTLRGTGQINASLVNNGSVAPGHSVGTLSVNGAYTQGPAGVLDIQLSESGASKLLVSGTAVLSGSLRITPLDGFVPGFGQTFPVLGAGQGITGTFNTLDVPTLPGGLFYQPLYRADSVGVMAAAPLSRFAASSNQRAVALTLDQLHADPDPALQKILSALYTAEVTGGLATGLDRVAPQNAFDATLLGRRFVDLLDNQLAARAGALRRGATGFSADFGGFDPAGGEIGELHDAASPNRPAASDGASRSVDATDGLAGFVSGQVGWGNRAITATEPEHSLTVGGMTLGFDYRIDPASAIGVAGSYFSGDAGIAGESTDARAGALSLYGMTQAGPLDLEGAISGGITGYDTARRLPLDGSTMTAAAAPGGHFVASFGTAEYRFARQTSGGTLSGGPVAEIRFSNIAVDGYHESGLGPLSSYLRGRDVNSLQTGIGAEAALAIPTARGDLVPHLRVLWRHEYAAAGETAAARFVIAPEAPFTLRSLPLGRDYALLGAGIAGPLGAAITVSADYLGEVGRRNEVVHQVSLTARIAF